MTLWVDADACPKVVKDLIFRAAERLAVRTVLVANAPIFTPPSAHISTVQVGAGLDIADAYIAKEAQPGDVAITADVPLAAALVRKQVEVIDPRGELFTPDNVEERLAMRDLLHELRESGVQTRGPKAFSPADKQQFANALDRVLNAALRRQGTATR